MRNPNKVSAAKDGPPPQEWLFDSSSLPDEDVVAAYFWEFGLDTPDVIEAVELAREKARRYEGRNVEAYMKWILENPFPADFGQWGEWGKRSLAANPDYDLTTKLDYDTHFLVEWQEFPKSHWLAIPASIRRDAKRMRPVVDKAGRWREPLNEAYHRADMEAREFDSDSALFFKTQFGIGCHTWIPDYALDENTKVQWWREWAETTKSKGGMASADRWEEYRLFQINWARSDRRLKDDFAKWLKENRPDDRQALYNAEASASRRTSHRDLLKALGAFRLLRHFAGDWQQAAGFSVLFRRNGKGIPSPLYAEQSEWRDAEKRAKQALEQFSTDRRAHV